MNNNKKIVPLTEWDYSKKRTDFTEHELYLLDKFNRTKVKAFEFSLNGVNTRNYVGIIKLGKRTVQIIPKIFKGDDEANKNLDFLIYMLNYTNYLKVHDTYNQYSGKFKFDFIEHMIYIFSMKAKELLLNNMNKSYVPIEENSAFIKGKLLLSKHYKYNPIKSISQSPKYYCKFDIYSENNLLNQTIKYVSYKLLQITNQLETKRNLNYICKYLKDVDLKNINKSQIQKIKFNRLNSKYIPVINLCILFISHFSNTFTEGKIETFSMMFDMNRLFEEFIFFCLLKELGNNKSFKRTVSSIKCNESDETYRYECNYEVKNIYSANYKKFMLSEGFGKLFEISELKPDILVKLRVKGPQSEDRNDSGAQIDEDVEIIIDAKYHSDNKTRPQEDVLKQLFTYSQAPRDEKSKYKKLILIYPNSTFKKFYKYSEKNCKLEVTVGKVQREYLVYKHEFDNSNIQLFVAGIDLQGIANIQKNQNTESKLLDELKDIIACGSVDWTGYINSRKVAVDHKKIHY